MDERRLLEKEDRRTRKKRNENGDPAKKTTPNSARRQSKRIRNYHSKKQGFSDAKDTNGGEKKPDGPSPESESHPPVPASSRRIARAGNRIEPDPADTEVRFVQISSQGRAKKKPILKMRDGAVIDMKIPDPLLPRTIDFDTSPVKTNGLQSVQSVRVLDTKGAPLTSKTPPKPTIKPLLEEEEETGKRASPSVPTEKPIGTKPSVPTTEDNKATVPEADTGPDVNADTREKIPEAQSELEQISLFDEKVFEKTAVKEARKEERKAANLKKQRSPPSDDAVNEEEKKLEEPTEENAVEEVRATTPHTTQPPIPAEEEEILDEGCLPTGDYEIQIVGTAVQEDDKDGSGREKQAQKRKRSEEEEEYIEPANQVESRDGSEVELDEEDNSQERVVFNVDHVSRIFESFLSKRGIVVLAYNGITDNIFKDTIIPKLNNLLLVQEVRLSRNILSKLPDEFQNSCSRARCLTLTSNRISRLPRWFCDVCSQPLKQLFLGCNGLEELPLNMAELKYLEVLDVSNNELKEIPAGLGELRRMKILNLSHNQLTRLPDDIGAENEKLLCLDISDNNNFFAPLPPLLEKRAYTMEDLFISYTKLRSVLKKKELEGTTREVILFLSTLTNDDLLARLEQKLQNEEGKRRRSQRLS